MIKLFKFKNKNNKPTNNYLAKKTVIGFVEGEIGPKKFLEMFQKDDDIYNWIQSIVPKKKTCYKHTSYKVTTKFGNSHTQIKEEIVPYDIKLIIEQHLSTKENIYGIYLDIHHEIASLIREVFPEENIKVSNELDNIFLFMLEACPEYIGGPDVESSGILEELLKNIPQNLSQTGQKDWYKDQLKAKFHVTSTKYPRWIQTPDWPVSNGRPMRFVSQEKANPEGISYLFEDIETGEQRIVFQTT